MNKFKLWRFLILTSCYALSASLYSQNENIQFLKREISTTKESIKKLEPILKLSYAYEDISLDSMEYYAFEAKRIATNLGETKLLMQANLCIGISQWRKGQLSLGLKTIDSVLTFSSNGNHKLLEAKAKHEKGKIFNFQGLYSDALDISLTALALAENLKDSVLITDIFRSTGGIHFNLKDYNSAIDYWQMGLNIAEIKNYKITKASLLNNIGAIHKQNNELNSALVFYLKALNTHSKNSCQRIYSYINIGDLYTEKSMYDSAYKYFNEAKVLSKVCDDFVTLIATTIALSRVDKKNGQYLTAIKTLKKALQLTGSDEYLREKSKIIIELSDTYEQIDNIDSALHYYKKYTILQNSIINYETSIRISEIEANSEIEKIQSKQAITLLAKEKRLAAQTFLSIIFIFGFIIMIIIAGFYYRNFKKKKSSNIILQKLNKEVETQKIILKSQAQELQILNTKLEIKVKDRTKDLKIRNAELKEKNDKLSEYAFINSHLLRAPLSKIMAISNLIAQEDFEVNKELNEALVTSSKELDEIIHKIAQLVSEKNN